MFVLSRQIVSTLLQDLDQRLSNVVAGDYEVIRTISLGKIFDQEFVKFLHAGIVTPLMVAWVH